MLAANPSEKWWSEFVSWDDDIPFPTEWKVIQNSKMFQSPPTRYIVIPVINHYWPIMSSHHQSEINLGDRWKTQCITGSTLGSEPYAIWGWQHTVDGRWWKISCTTKRMLETCWNPRNSGINHLSTGAGFLPSPLWLNSSEFYHTLSLRQDVFFSLRHFMAEMRNDGNWAQSYKIRIFAVTHHFDDLKIWNRHWISDSLPRSHGMSSSRAFRILARYDPSGKGKSPQLPWVNIQKNKRFDFYFWCWY